MTRNVNRVGRLGGHLTNSTANNALVRWEAVVPVDINNPAVVAPAVVATALADEAGAGHDGGKRKKE